MLQWEITPQMLVVTTTRRYTEIFSFIHYEKVDRLCFGVFSKLVCMRYRCTLHQTLYAWLM